MNIEDHVGFADKFTERIGADVFDNAGDCGIIALVMTDNRPLSEFFEEVAEQWVDADAAASLLEDCKSAFLAERMLLHSDLPVNRAEGLVKSSPEWKDYVEKTVAARRLANLYKLKIEALRMRFSEWQSQ